ILRFLRVQKAILAEVEALVERELVEPLPVLLPTVELVDLEPAPDTWVTVEGEIIQGEPLSISKAQEGFLVAPRELAGTHLGSMPDAPLADVVPVRPEIRLDSCPGCGVRAPLWYQAALQGYWKGSRYDAAVLGRMGEILGFLEVAISEVVGERNLGPLLAPVAREIYRHNRAEMERVLQIDLRGQSLGLQPFITEFIGKNVRLIQSVMFDQLHRMEEVIAEGTAGQVRVETLAAQLMDTFKVSKARANLIARDQTLKANAEVTQLRQQQVGVTEYIWTSSRDERVRGRPGGPKSDADHWALEGTRQSWLVAPVTNPKTGERNHPGMDYQCRCTATPIVDHLLGA
ncbi:MAG: minor capsid protein, partial [Thermoplasmata archaeon]|nr:minor capsid protein [Thermoplasmata archaeon]